MAKNLFISYDLNNPGQKYDDVIAAIKTLGNWAKVQKSFWYVKSQYTASEAVDVVWKKMDKNDSLLVVDATNKNAAWRGLAEEVADFIRDKWNK